MNVYRFDHKQTNLYPQYKNIFIQQWYNKNIPEITHFFFIKNTEDICFVDNGGRAQFYNLDNKCFQRRKSQLPINTDHILGAPDGTCFIAFAKERPSSRSSTQNFAVAKAGFTADTKKILIIPATILSTDSSATDVIKAHVYFYENLAEDACKIMDFPFADSSINHTRFLIFANQQIHLTTIDQQNGNFKSVLVKITHAKAKYQFERQHNLKSLGQVKFEKAYPSLALGKDTKFTQDTQKGDLLVIGIEKRVISEILSNVELKINNPFKYVESEKLYDFRIESRSYLNDILDAYSMVFTKYAINSPIGRIDKPLSVYIALDLKHQKIDNYSGKFSEYFNKMWKKFEEETKKPLVISWISSQLSSHIDLMKIFTNYLLNIYLESTYLLKILSLYQT